MPSRQYTAGRPGTPRRLANAADQVSQLRPQFRRCYASALAQDPTEEGSLVLEIELGPKGDDRAAASTMPRGTSRGLLQCIEAVTLGGSD